jgi:CheY-like chemotaxis protein
MNSTDPHLDRTTTLLEFPPQVRLLPAARPRVLVADDDRGIRESLGKLLRNAGCHVTLAAQGGQVLELALNEPFDLLLLDLNMPGMDGWDALDHLASLKPTLPIIIITAQPNQRDWAMNSGAHALMEKPLDLALLLQTVRDFLRNPPVAELQRGSPSADRFRFGWPRRNGTGIQRGGINE